MSYLSISGKIWNGKEPKDGILWVNQETGLIEKIAKTQKADEHIDLSKKIIVPGAIDVHVHFREPGHTHKEDIQSGSIAAAYGGVTAFVDMPNTLPPTTTLRAIQDKHELAKASSVIDYGFWAGSTWYTGEMKDMLKYAVGAKVYLGATTGDLLMDEHDAFVEILQTCAKAGKPVILHAEAQRVLNRMRRTEQSIVDHDQARPPVAEVEAIYDVMKTVATMKPSPTIHIAHCASIEAVRAANSAKFSNGICPHHLMLDTGMKLEHAYAKVNPPIRDAEQREAMWEAFASGEVGILESDHAPHTKTEKEDTFHGAPAGLPGVETMVPMMMAQVKAKKLELSRLIEASVTKPAQLLGLTDRGELKKGMRADFAVYDLTKASKIKQENLHSKCRWSPFNGKMAIFPSHTFVAGKPVISEGKFVGEPGTGRSLVDLPK